MNQKILNKILATTLAIVLTFTNFIMLGVYASKTYAISDNLENQDITANNENVEFDAYFNVDSKKSHTLKQDINKEDIKLSLYVNVKKGYLKNSKIEMGEDANFNIKNTDQNLESIENINVENNNIALKQINSGTRGHFRNTNCKYKK